MDEKVKLPYTIGAFVRGTWRRVLLVRGLKYDEDKGWFDSVFLVEATRAQHDELFQLIDDYNKAGK